MARLQEGPAKIIDEPLIVGFELDRAPGRRDRFLVKPLVASTAADALMKDRDVRKPQGRRPKQIKTVLVSLATDQKVASVVDDVAHVNGVRRLREQQVKESASLGVFAALVLDRPEAEDCGGVFRIALERAAQSRNRSFQVARGRTEDAVCVGRFSLELSRTCGRTRLPN
jgi:hypothetical protein